MEGALVTGSVSNLLCIAISQYFQKVIPQQFDSCPDKLIHKAYQVKYNPKRMKRYEETTSLNKNYCLASKLRHCVGFLFRLEKEYAAIKSKEMEEQIEIKVSNHT